MTFVPRDRGREVSALFLEHEPRLFADLAQSEVGGPAAAAPDAAREWQIFALYACVRGLVAGGGFNRETAAAIETMHAAVTERWVQTFPPGESLDSRRALVAARYEEYGAIGQAGGKAGAMTVTMRLGEAAARHMIGAAPSAELAELVGALHESLAEAVAAQIRGS